MYSRWILGYIIVCLAHELDRGGDRGALAVHLLTNYTE
jgi:hypothetical protein